MGYNFVMSHRYSTLDETLELRHPDGTPWHLGRALSAIGPGWWGLLRMVYSAVAESPGVSVIDVRQKAARLVISLAPHSGVGRVYRVAADATRESAEICEACAASVPPVENGRPRSRTHCARCIVRLGELVGEHRGGAERRLWMECSGRWLPEWW